MIDIQVDDRTARAFLSDLEQRQIPFARALALNRTGDDGQAAVRKHLGQVFTLRRRDFIERTIKIENRDRATKTSPFVIVGIDPTRDVLAKFEIGGQKTPISGKALAVPINARRNKSDIVAKPNRIKGLNLRRVGNQIIGDKGTFIAGGAILQRVGKRSRTVGPVQWGQDPNVKVLYAFEDSVPIQPALHFVDIMTHTVEQRWVPNFEGAFALAVRTAR